MIKVLLFASLREQAGLEQLLLPLTETTVAGLLEDLKQRHPELQLQQLMVAVNEEIALHSDPVRTGDTVALLPPVSGG